jgi:AraC family L-rhamnose operon transcriptional activator RhaR
MPIRRTIESLSGQTFFEPDFPLFVNRVSESFELLEHSHDFVEISYIGEGTGFHYIGDEVLPVHKGDLFYIPVGTSHVFRPANASSKERLIVYNCIFHQQIFDKIMKNESHMWTSSDKDELQALQREKDWLVHRESFEEIAVLMNQLYAEFSDNKPARRMMLFSYLLQLFVRLARSKHGLPSAESMPLRSRLDIVLEDIQERLADPPSLSEIAAQINISTRQFHRLMKKATGQTYIEYIHSKRIQKCCDLLKRTDDKISEVAEQTGYKDMKYFHALFKRKTGLSPRQFRIQSNNLMLLVRGSEPN